MRIEIEYERKLSLMKETLNTKWKQSYENRFRTSVGRKKEIGKQNAFHTIMTLRK